jgi:hypothetical protein
MAERNMSLVGATCAVLALLIGGCATIESGGFKVDKADTERSFDEVRARAAWDFRCPPENIELVVLAVIDGGSWADRPVQIGAVACGQRAVYISTRSGWALNAALVDLHGR